MKLTSNRCFFILAIILAPLTSCKVSYSFSGASVSPDVKTVSIQYFKNNAALAPPTLSQSLTEALKDIFISQTSLAIVTRDGDLNFEGEIVSYQTAPIALQANDQSALNRLTITVTVRFSNVKDEKQKFEVGFTRFADFPSSQPIAAVQEALMVQINDQLVQDIFNRAMINW